jgi:hypothetical protein
MTPQRTFEYQSPPDDLPPSAVGGASASSGSSTNSDNGFSSNVSVNDGEGSAEDEDGVVEWTTVGVMLRNDLKPTWDIIC